MAGFAAALLAQYPDALAFRVMGDDFVLLAARGEVLDGARLKAQSPLKDTAVEVEVRELDLQSADRDYLEQLD